MPGIIVSRPIFNTLFKLAHEEGLSINAFLTRLLESAGPDAVKQAVTGRPLTSDSSSVSQNGQVGPVGDAPDGPATPDAAEIVGTERLDDELATSPAVRQHVVRPIEYDEAPVHAGVAEPDLSSAPGRRIGNSVWDKVVSMEGHRFATSRGKKFSYKVTGEYIVVRDSQARIPRSQFDKAQKMWPVTGPSRLVGVYAPSVVWAVMRAVTEAEEPALA